MATSTFSQGFSYAQAAKGRTSATTSQTPSSKVTSGTATPATGTFSELTPGGSWADDVESSVKEQKAEPQSTQQEETKDSTPKDVSVERAKSEDAQQPNVSTVSSPDITASSSTTTKEDDASSGPNAPSSDSTWETKSQTSEPAWIVERSQRQNGNLQNEKAGKVDNKSTEASVPTPAKPMVLHEAPPPMENPWFKRAAEVQARAKMMQSKPPIPSSFTSAPKNKENQKPVNGGQQKSSSTPSPPNGSMTPNADDTRKTASVQTKRGSDARATTSRHGSKSAQDAGRSDSAFAGASKGSSTDRSSIPNNSPAPPSVDDQASWPTPVTAELADKERKESTDKETVEKRDDDPTPVTKRKKPQYAPIAITPTFKFETQFEPKKRGPPNADRSTRPTNAARGGRGGHRGANGTDRQPAHQPESSPSNAQTEATTNNREPGENRDREAILTPSKQVRASSAGATPDRKKETPAERNPRSLGFTDAKQSGNVVPASAKVEQTPNGSFSKPFSELRRNTSPKKSELDGKDEIVPKPIPRRSSFSTQAAEDAPDPSQKNTRGQPPVRMVPSENRKENRGFGESRDQPFTGTTRGSKRNGRGRGGARELANGHPATPAYPGNYGADFANASSFAVPPSPSAYHSSRGNHQFSHPAQGRGGWRANPRSQSIPIDSYYNQRFGGQYPGGQHAPPHVQTYFPGMYDVNGYPMSAMPYPVHPDIHNLTMMLSIQLEYYFSVDNLLKDTFLRRHMDSQGFVFLDVIANFNRIKQLTQDKDLLKAVCIDSSVIEIRVGEDGKERLRRQEGWQQFPFEMDQRDPSAQNKGPEHLERIERPQVAVNNIPPQYRGPASAGIPPMHPRFDRRSYDSQYAMMEGYAHQLHWGGGFSDDMYNEGFNGDEVRGRTVKSPTNETVLSPKREHTPAPPAESGVVDQDPFPDDQTAALTVVVRMGEKRASYHSAASRTFSNGSIDSRNALPESEPPSSSKSKPLVNGDSHINGGEDGSKHTRHISPNKVSSTERPATNTDVNNVFWVKDQEYPVESLPRGINSYPYNQLRSESLEQRNEARTGTCPPKLNILYEFWCHFLIRNFNSGMYSEFKRLANEDASDRYDFVGLQNLVKFYAQSLSSQNMIRDQVARDYVQLVNEEPAKLENAAFKSLRSAWRNGALNLKNRKKLANVLDDKLKEKLDSTAA